MSDRRDAAAWRTVLTEPFPMTSKLCFDLYVLSPGRLLVLHMVAQHGSLSAAARALGYSQPAIAQQMRRLEAEAGAPLLIRTSRGVRLTEAGFALVEHAAAIADELSRAEQDVSRYARRGGLRVRLAAFSACHATIVAQAIAYLRDTASPVELDLVTAGPSEALTMLEAGGCDVAVIFDFPGMRRPRRRAWRRVRLARDRVFVALPATHRLAGQGDLRLSDLAKEQWVISGHCVVDVIGVCHTAGFTPKVGLATDDPFAMPKLVAAGFGVAIVSDLLLSAVPGPDVALRPLMMPPRTIAAIADQTSIRTPAVGATLEALKVAAAAITADSDQRATG